MGFKIQFQGTREAFIDALENQIAVEGLPIALVTPKATELVAIVSKTGTSKIFFSLEQVPTASEVFTHCELTGLKLAFLHKPLASKMKKEIVKLATAIGASVIIS